MLQLDSGNVHVKAPAVLTGHDGGTQVVCALSSTSGNVTSVVCRINAAVVPSQATRWISETACALWNMYSLGLFLLITITGGKTWIRQVFPIRLAFMGELAVLSSWPLCFPKPMVIACVLHMAQSRVSGPPKYL
eukprot:g9792.t1